MPTAHVIGAGLAGLAAAVALARSPGWRVVLHEAAGHAGGRCRSYRDEVLGRDIDNGSHLMLAAYTATLDYLRALGASDRVLVAARTEVDFVDLRDGAAWRLSPNEGRLPWWVFVPGRRVPGTRARHYLEGLRLLRAPAGAAVADCLDAGSPLYERLWRPLVEGIMNAAPAEADAGAMAEALRLTFGRGGRACRPVLAVRGLSHALVEPALDALRGAGADIRLGDRLRAIDLAPDAVRALRFESGDVPLGPGDRAVLAVTPPVAAALLPGITVPEGSRAIVNAHFRIDGKAWEPRFVGLVGGTAQWLFLRGDVLSVTVSAADALAERPAEAIAGALWPEAARGLDSVRQLHPEPIDQPGESHYQRRLAAAQHGGEPMPPAWRVVKEKRATFLQSPAQVRRRPGARTAWRNLLLAGDWTATALPATIEGAVRSGNVAARAALLG